jgi:hypothetical protein
MSLEERARASLVAVKAFRYEIPSWLQEETEAAQNRWLAGAANKDEVLALQSAIRNVTPAARHGEEDERIKSWFVSTLDASADFRALDELRQLVPGLVTAEEIRRLSNVAASTIESEFQDAIDSATTYGELEQARDALWDLAEAYGLDPAALLDDPRYEEQLDELGRIEDLHDDQALEEWRDSRSALRAEDDAIHALFETLDD